MPTPARAGRHRELVPPWSADAGAGGADGAAGPI
jgi:hypothetical protein